MNSTLIIIVSYNFMPWLRHCLGSLRELTVPCDVMVIDNLSKDETVDCIRREFPEVMLRPQNRNLGFGRANNIGLAYALEHHYEGVLLLNQDAWLDADALQKLIEAARAHPDYGIISPVHLVGSGKHVEHGFSVYTGLKLPQQRPAAPIVPCKFIDAALWYMPCSVVRKVGGFAPLFYHYGEDKDMANRMTYFGYKTGYVPAATGYHDREFRPTTRKGRIHSEKVYMLSEYANPNYRLVGAFAMSVLASIKKSLIYATRLQWRDSLCMLSIAGWLVGKTARVVATRRQNRQPGNKPMF